MNEDDIDDELDSNDDDYDGREEVPSANRMSVLKSRRRIEDLKELRRVRELLGEDDFNFDFEELN